jgi:hypothetical protein
MIPTYSDNHAEPGEHLTAARRLRLAAERCIDAAMAVEAAEGATTADLATWLALPADTVQVRLPADTRAAAAADPGERAAELDRWYAQTGGPDAPADAVSAGLF